LQGAEKGIRALKETYVKEDGPKHRDLLSIYFVSMSKTKWIRWA